MAVDYNNTVLHVGANIAYEEGENKEESRTDYNDKVVHADVTLNEYTKPGTGNIDEGTFEELQVLVASAKTAAKTSETNAKKSEANAASSASAAAVSESNASDSATAADASASSASSSASSASTSASTAATKANEASTSATNAAASAKSASDSAAAAALSEGAASDSADAASSSASTATTKASEAATSASNASSSASAASTSATNAAKSASDAKSYLDQMADVTIDLSKVSGVLDVAHGGTGQSTESGLKSYLEGLGFSTSSGTSIELPLSIAQGGTGATTASAAWTALGGGTIGKLNNVSLTTNVTGTLPIANGGTGVTSLDELKSALGISDAGSGSGSSNPYDLTETSFDFQNPTTGRLFVRYTNMTNFPNDNFLRNAVYNGDDNEYIDAVATSAASCILECTKVTDSSGNVVYFLTVSRCVPSVAPAENKLARCYGYGKPTTKGSSTTITWAFRQDYW